jgi:hypothetical protein
MAVVYMEPIGPTRTPQNAIPAFSDTMTVRSLAWARGLHSHPPISRERQGT